MNKFLDDTMICAKHVFVHHESSCYGLTWCLWLVFKRAINIQAYRLYVKTHIDLYAGHKLFVFQGKKCMGQLTDEVDL